MRSMLGSVLLVSALVLRGAQVQEHPMTVDDVAAGAKMFRSHCAQCHGPKGEGRLGPNLSGGVFYHGASDADLIQNISDGIPGTAMPGTFFDTAQVRQIVAYVRSLSSSGTAEAPAGDPKRGELVFHNKGCNTCHLVAGEGNVRGPDLSTIGSQRSADYLRKSILEPNDEVSSSYWVAKISVRNGNSYSGFVLNEDTYLLQILDFQKGLQTLPRDSFKEYKVERTSIMPSFKDQLSPQELEDLVSYLWSLKQRRRPE